MDEEVNGINSNYLNAVGPVAAFFSAWGITDIHSSVSEPDPRQSTELIKKGTIKILIGASFLALKKGINDSSQGSLSTNILKNFITIESYCNPVFFLWGWGQCGYSLFRSRQSFAPMLSGAAKIAYSLTARGISNILTSPPNMAIQPDLRIITATMGTFGMAQICLSRFQMDPQRRRELFAFGAIKVAVAVLASAAEIKIRDFS